MSIASEISRIQSAKTDIREAIEAKGVTVPDSEHIDTYPDYISQIQQGGGGAAEVPANLESWAYDDWGRATSATTTAGTGNLGSIFQGNQVLKDIVIKGYTSLDDGAFSGCTSLTGITIPSDVTSLGSSCFESCTSLSGITLPDGLTLLGYSCFNNCASLTEITIPSGVTLLDYNCFQNCFSLTGITIPNSVTSLGGCCFQNCTSLTGITIPSGVTSLAGSCFASCTSLTGITIPSGVKFLDYSCFENCTSLSGITIPNGVTSLGYSCFNNCASLTGITIPSGVTLLDFMCFQNCTSLESITVEATTPPSLGFSAFDNTNNCPIYVPCGTVETYKAASGWSDYATRIFENPSCSDTGDTGNTKITYNLQDGTTGSVECDFSERLDNDDIASVLPTMTSCTVGSCAKTVDKAFENAPMLSQVTLSEGIEAISDTAFNGCTALTSITIPESTTMVGGFKGCTNLASVTLGSNVTDLLPNAFSGCTSLTGITIPSGTSVPINCFSHCTGLTWVTLEDGVPTIDDNAFYNCSSLTGITIPNSVTAIKYAAFDGCTALTEVTIPIGVTSLGGSCFNGCTSLASITVKASTPPTLGSLAFQGTAESLIIYVPRLSFEEYKRTPGWSDYADKIQEDPTSPIA